MTSEFYNEGYSELTKFILVYGGAEFSGISIPEPVVFLTSKYVALPGFAKVGMLREELGADRIFISISGIVGILKARGEFLPCSESDPFISGMRYVALRQERFTEKEIKSAIATLDGRLFDERFS